jgi:Phytanoyl-CoA dioxygenase (PhyH)
MLRELLEETPGFATGLKLQPSELERLRALIEQQWLSCIQQVTPEHTQSFAERGIARYHELSHLLDHSSLWSRHARMLPESAVAEVRQMSLFKQLEAEFASVTISDEENVGWESMHWRLVRPGQPSDVGPIHADRWFWDLNGWPIPPNMQRFKVWIAIFCETGLSGLRLVPDSHLRDWSYQGEQRHGVLKPQLQVDEQELFPKLFHSQPGDAIAFNYNLLHGGAMGSGTLTRVSLEFTIFVPK